MPRVYPGFSEIRHFFAGATIDPNKKGNEVEKQLVELGEPSYYETKVIEYMQEARRLRDRMTNAKGRELTTLQEKYYLTMKNAATSLAIAANKVMPKPKPKPKPKEAVPPTEGTGN